MKGDTMQTLPPPVKFTVTADDLVNTKHFDDGIQFDLAELSKMVDLGIKLTDVSGEDGQAATVQALMFSAWVWARREYAPGLSWEDAQERIRLVFE